MGGDYNLFMNEIDESESEEQVSPMKNERLLSLSNISGITYS